jgi:hypothetical protein
MRGTSNAANDLRSRTKIRFVSSALALILPRGSAYVYPIVMWGFLMFGSKAEKCYYNAFFRAKSTRESRPTHTL